MKDTLAMRFYVKTLSLLLGSSLLVMGSASFAQEQAPQPEAFYNANGAEEQPLFEDQPQEQVQQVAPTQAVAPNTFFDGESLVPSGQMVTQTPRNVDPGTQPGSRFVIVSKTHEPGSMQARIVSGERALKLGLDSAAVEIFEGLYRENRRDPAILSGLALAYQKTGNSEQAIRLYEQLADIDPRNVEARINLLGLVGGRYPAVALQRLIELRREYPDHAGVAAQIAVMKAELGHYDEAIQYLGVAASMEPQNPNHIFNMGVISDRRGHKPEAIKYYEQALELDTLYGAGKMIPREIVFERLAQLR